jgi:hypothetical protein
LDELVQHNLPDKTVTVINTGIASFDTVKRIVNQVLRLMPFDSDGVIIHHPNNGLTRARQDLPTPPDGIGFHPSP